MKPLALDLFCGLGGWAEGLIATGWSVVGFDIEDKFRAVYPGFFIQADVMELTADSLAKFGASLIVASPPCQKYSYMSMPWKQAKAMREWYREDSSRVDDLNMLFRKCESLAAEMSVPIVIENVKGAQLWVGSAAAHYGSFYLWGNVPALLPMAGRCRKVNIHAGGDVPAGTGSSSWFFGNTKHELRDGIKQGGAWWSDPESMTRKYGSRSEARKAASARIAKIPFPLARWIGEVYRDA